MRILLASSSSGSRGGGEIYLRYLAQGLREQGHQVGLWCSEHQRMDELTQSCRESSEILRSPYCNTYDRPLRSLGAWIDFKTPKKLANIWSQWKPDVIHLNKQNLEDGIELLRAGNLLCERDKIPTFATIHITQPASYLKPKAGKLRDHIARHSLISNAMPFITVSDARTKDLDLFLNGQYTNDIHTIYNGVPHAPSADQISASRSQIRSDLHWENALVFIDVGRMVPQKNPLQFLHSMHSIQQQFPNQIFRGIWVGDGPLRREWETLAQQLKLQVHCTGWQSNPSPWLAAADVFLHPAEYEGLPLAILEAMHHALPIIAREEIVQECHPLAETIIPLEDLPWMEMVVSESMRAHAANRSNAQAKALFSIQSMAEACLRLYQL